MAEDLITMLKRAAAATGPLVARVRADQWHCGTPCPDFDVRALVQHMIGGLQQFAGVVRGEPSDATVQPALASTADETSHDAHQSAYAEAQAYHEVYDEAARRAVAAWASPHALDREYDMPWGRVTGRVLVGFLLIEALGHGWDLAQATGQDAAYDEDLVSEVLERAHAYDGPGMRGPGLFGPAVEVPADAPVLDRLIAFLGRHPTAAWPP